jgi:hypothetical protein
MYMLCLTRFFFSTCRPPIFISIFKIGGAITVLGQHLINLKCMFPDMSDGDVFFRIQLLWGVAPPVLLILCVATWQLISKCKNIEELDIKMKTSCVALLYLIWPSLCAQAFSLFACRSVCQDNISFLRADLDEVCWSGKHLHYALGVGLPMLFIYVIGLPLITYVRVHAMNQKLVTHTNMRALSNRRRLSRLETVQLDFFADEHRIYGMFYSAFRKEMWWWEGTVAARKIVIALIGVFGTEMGDMQVHLSLMLVVFILLVTSQIRPFGGLKHGILHVLEMASLMVSTLVVIFFLLFSRRIFIDFYCFYFDGQATFLTLWAGSVFNARPRCEDPLQGEGSTLVWCDVLSVTVGLVDIVVVAAIGFCFAYLKIKSMSTEVGEATAENGGEGSSFSEILSNARDSVQRWRFGRMTPEAQQRAIRRRTFDAADGNTAENPATVEMTGIAIEMTGIYAGESSGEIKVDDGKVDSTMKKDGGLMYENPARRRDNSM